MASRKKDPDVASISYKVIDHQTKVNICTALLTQAEADHYLTKTRHESTTLETNRGDREPVLKALEEQMADGARVISHLQEKLGKLQDA